MSTQSIRDYARKAFTNEAAHLVVDLLCSEIERLDAALEASKPAAEAAGAKLADEAVAEAEALLAQAEAKLKLEDPKAQPPK